MKRLEGSSDKKSLLHVQGPLGANHRCMGKGKEHYIELFSDEEDDEETSHDQEETNDSPKEE